MENHSAALLEIRSGNESLQKLNDLKDQHLINLCHEIKTPLTTIIGFTEILSNSILNNEQAHQIEIVSLAAENLFKLVSNLLDFSKLSSGNMVLEVLPISLADIIKTVVALQLYSATQKGIKIHINIDAHLPGTVMGDQLRLTQVFTNLLTNAIKYTIKGTIQISCKEVAVVDDSKHYISFTVKDTGLGIAKEKQSHLFERYTQASQDAQQLFGGTGLGLNIVKQIVILHQGTLNMESEPGKGTSFCIELPFKKLVAPVIALNNLPIVAKEKLVEKEEVIYTILLAEDNDINALLATKILTAKGHTVVRVNNGEMAVAVIQQQYFDLVLMDVEMPVMNGVAAAKAIRQLPTAAAHTPIIAISAHARSDRKSECGNAGMNGYLSKPFLQQDLWYAIAQAVPNSRNNQLSNKVISL